MILQMMTLGIYHGKMKRPVPNWLRKLVDVLLYKGVCAGSNRVGSLGDKCTRETTNSTETPVQSITLQPNNGDVDSRAIGGHGKNSDTEPKTQQKLWVELAEDLDCFFFRFFVTVQIILMLSVFILLQNM